MKMTAEVTSLSECLRFQMFLNNHSTRDLAKTLGVSNSTVWRIINGGSYFARLVIPIAKYCRINPEQLWDLLEENNEGI